MSDEKRMTAAERMAAAKERIAAAKDRLAAARERAQAKRAPKPPRDQQPTLTGDDLANAEEQP